MNLGHVFKFMLCTIKARVVFVWLDFTANANSQIIAHFQRAGTSTKRPVIMRVDTTEIFLFHSCKSSDFMVMWT